jgi:hypothetical protein
MVAAKPATKAVPSSAPKKTTVTAAPTKEDVKKNPVIVMASYSGLTVHQIDLDSIDERIEQLVDAVS